MTGFDDSQVWLGTWARVWLNSSLLSEATAFRAEITLNYEDVKRTRNLMTGKKLTGLEGEGEITLHKVDSSILNLVAADIKRGIVPDITIESSQQDPAGVGEERIAVKHVKFEKITLADWEAGELESQTLSFSFTDYEIKNVAL
jgi:hypothetical protein